MTSISPQPLFQGIRGQLALWLLLAFSLPCAGQTPVLESIGRAEQLGWSDPQRALQWLEQLRSQATDEPTLEEWLQVRGFLLVDTRRDPETQALIARLEDLGRRYASAKSAAHMVRAYLFCQNDQIREGAAELSAIEPTPQTLPLTRYRVETLKGSVLRFTGQHEAAMLAYERAIDVAESMHSRGREVAAMIKLAWVLMQTGNLDKAAGQLSAARQLATEDKDEPGLASIARNDADLADRRGDRRGERRASLEELEHARQSAAAPLMALAYADLGDSYMKTGEFVQSLDYSRRAAALAPQIARNSFESTVQFNMALAQIGLGNLHDGKALAEAAIKHTLDSGNLVDADDLLREYGPFLERAGDMKGALEIYHRNEALRERLMSAAREQALLELSTRFDAERRTRQIELLRRDNALKDHDLLAQRLHQKTVLIATGLIGLACAALGWAFRRIRKVNARLLFESQHDTLTGLYNRRFFNEQVLAPGGDAAFRGCVLLIDLDHFKHINDTFGHPAGDAVLAAVGQRMMNALSRDSRLVRWGGEEFLALLDPMPDVQLNAIMHRVLSVIRDQPVAWNGQMIRCTVSIGCASFPVLGARARISLERAIGLVDKALYEAKRRGRNRACLLSVIDAASEQSFSAINADFAAALDDRRVLMVETISHEVTRGTVETSRVRAS